MPRYPVFTPQEISVFRKAIDAYRAPGAYEPGKWSVSPLNRRPEIVGTMPGKIVLRDIAVRTTEQMPGVVLPAAERMRLLQQSMIVCQHSSPEKRVPPPPRLLV